MVEVTEEVTLGIGTAGGAVSAAVAWELVFLDREAGLEAGRARLVVLAEGEAFMPKSDSAVVSPATWEGPGLEMGCCTLVERMMMSLPWTTRLSLDFFSSSVSISEWRHERSI